MVNLALQKDVISETSNYPTESVVVMLTGPPTGRTRNRGSIADGVKRVFTSTKLSRPYLILTEVLTDWLLGTVLREWS